MLDFSRELGSMARYTMCTLAIFVLACSRPSAPTTTALTTEPRPLDHTASRDDTPTRDSAPRVISTINWSSPLGISLVGVDPNRRSALVQLEDPRGTPKLSWRVISLDTGETTREWTATPKRARSMVKGYPAFRGVDSDFSSDLVTYANLLSDIGPWSHREATPPLSVLPSPDASLIVHGQQPGDGADGDWLVLYDQEGKRRGRVDRGLRASYNPSFSPDGAHIAWIGGSAQFARAGKQIGYVLRLANTSNPTKHVAIPAVRDVLRTPIWSLDGETMFVSGQRSRRRRCLFSVKVSSRSVQELLCLDGEFDLIASPSTRTAMLLHHPPEVSDTKELLHVSLETGELLTRAQVLSPQGFGAFGFWLGDDAFAALTRLGKTLDVINVNTGERSRTIELARGSELRGRHGARVIDDELIILRQTAEKQIELIALPL